MTEQSLVERVGKRLEDFWMGPERAYIPLEADMRVMFNAMARAAIAAMREPTQAMRRRKEMSEMMYGCARGHQWIAPEGPQPYGTLGCPQCAMDAQQESARIANAASQMKIAILEALREFLPELVAALKEPRGSP